MVEDTEVFGVLNFHNFIKKASADGPISTNFFKKVNIIYEYILSVWVKMLISNF